jgi:hypothetical protein
MPGHWTLHLCWREPGAVLKFFEKVEEREHSFFSTVAGALSVGSIVNSLLNMSFLLLAAALLMWAKAHMGSTFVSVYFFLFYLVIGTSSVEKKNPAVS